jgi:hypothetical protein
MLRSIRPKRAVSLALARTIASSTAVEIAQCKSSEVRPGIGSTRGRRYGPTTSSA